MTPKLLRIPVVSGIEGLAAAVRLRLSTPAAPSSSSSPSASQILFAQSQLEIVDVPPPPSTGPWQLTSDQREALEHASVLLADSSVGARLLLPVVGEDEQLARPQRLEWMQSTFAGVEPFFQRLARTEAREAAPPFTVTRAGGIMSLAMAQYVLGWIITLERQFLEAEHFQRRGEYAHEKMRYRSFRGLTVAILGLGDIGQGVGRLLKAAGFRVVGFKRRVDPSAAATARLRSCADEVSGDLDGVLSQADYIVSVLPSTPATRRLLSEARLAAACREKRPALLSVGRGDVVAEEVLVAALDRRLLSRAVLDVAEQEPPPKHSALWTHPKVLLTPHVAALSLPEDVADAFARNLDLFLGRQPLRYCVDWAHGY